MFHRTLIATITLFLVSPAHAADLSAPDESFKDAPSAIAVDWSGFYAGMNLGYGWAEGDGGLKVFDPNGRQYPAGSLSYDLEADGVFGGAQIGYNRQSGRVVIGLEADIQASGIEGTETTSFDPPAIANFDYKATTEVEWFGTVRARLGYAFDRTLVYVTGGLAFAEIDYSARYIFTDPGCCAGSFGMVKGGDTETGYVLGAGVERAIGNAWSVKLEYQYLNFEDGEANGNLFFRDGAPSGETVKTEYDLDFHTVRVGLNYRFPPREAEPLK